MTEQDTVVITGMGSITPLGSNVGQMFEALKMGRTGVRKMKDWQKYEGMRTQVGANAVPYDSMRIPRQSRRTMSPMSEMGLLAALEALHQAGIESFSSERNLLCMGSTTGSPETFELYFRKFIERNGPSGQLSTSFFKVMNHSLASNVAVGLSYSGPQLAVSSACSTSSQAIVVGWELIRSGQYDIVLAGGADELHHTSAAIFDNVHAASTRYNDQPGATPRPFDQERDGLVVAEGAGMVVLERASQALRRGAKPLAQVNGGSYYCDGTHMTQPQVEGMVATMQAALNRAGLMASDVNYICAHGTGTQMGDLNEARATYEVFGDSTPISSLKGHLGHTLAACGSIEAIACVKMLEEQLLIPTRNLDNIDPELNNVRHVTSLESMPLRTIISNNFAFGGMNASLILSGWKE